VIQVSVQGVGRSESDMGSREGATLWQAVNNLHKIRRHIYSDTSSGVEPHTGLSSGSQPIEIFQKCVNCELVNLIEEETNAYQQKVKDKLISESKLGPKSRIHKLVAVIDDIYRFIVLIILVGIIHKAAMEMCWSIDEMLTTPFFGKCMSQNHLSSILRFFYFTSNETDDKINKIHPGYDHLITKFREMFRPGNSDCGREPYALKWLTGLETIH
jgi:hypothetical protein